MAEYEISCAERSPGCEGPLLTDLPYINLDDDQLDLINQGACFEVRQENIPAGYRLDPEQASQLAEDGYFEDDTDYREVCAECGSESSPGPDGTRIWT